MSAVLSVLLWSTMGATYESASTRRFFSLLLKIVEDARDIGADGEYLFTRQSRMF